MEPYDVKESNNIIRNIIKNDIQHINTDNIIYLIKCISCCSLYDLLVDVLNYLFESTIEYNIKYKIINNIYLISCVFDDIYILKSLMLYCFKHNCILDIHKRDDFAYFQTCIGNNNILQYLITMNKHSNYARWNFYNCLIEFNNNNGNISEFFNSLRYLFHMKQMKDRTAYYIFNNNIDYIDKFNHRILDKLNIPYILYCNICL